MDIQLTSTQKRALANLTDTSYEIVEILSDLYHINGDLEGIEFLHRELCHPSNPLFVLTKVHERYPGCEMSWPSVISLVSQYKRGLERERCEVISFYDKKPINMRRSSGQMYRL